MTMKTTHTPGPWAKCHDLAERRWLIVAPTGAPLAEVPNGNVADARLIAAAPELLAALVDCMANMDCLRDYVAEGAMHMVGARGAVTGADKALDIAAAALAKVEG